MHILSLAGVMLMAGHVLALEAEVRPHHGSPMIFVDGEPTSPLMFFGWAAGSGPEVRDIDTEWREYYYTFTAPETTDGTSGVHFRMGGDGPGTVWVDNVRFYPGPKVDEPEENWVRQGDWEGRREEIEREWAFFQAQYAGADADWALDPTTSVTGDQSLRIDIRHAGDEGNRMHLHFHQRGYSVEQGQEYTYSLWMKADRPRRVDFMALRIGEPWTIYGGPSSVYQQQVALAREAGVHIYSFGIHMPWPQPGEAPDFSRTDLAIRTTIAADPDALLLPRFGMAPPPWWLEEHPDDRMLFDDGETHGWSMASEAWREQMQEHLRALVRHCEEHYGDHMLGYHPCGQHTGEWFYYRSWEPRLSDFSPAMSRGFARWAREKYGTVEALRAAWNDPDITFEDITVPSAEEQLHTDIGFFRDPARERKVIDYFEYKQIAMVEPLEMMARVIKEETDREKLVCLFYGYTFDMHGIPMGPQTSGHLAMRRLIQSPDVDILCSPISYLDRQLGGVGCFMVAVDSVRGGGKLWLNEDDTRTYLTPADAGFGRVDTPQGTYEVLRRNFAQIWPRRLACWYMDLGNAGWFNSKDIWDEIALMQRFYREHIDRPARWAPQVALIVDEQSPWYTRCDRALHSPLVYQMRSQFFRLGVPFAIYLLGDLVEGRVPPMEAYFFANAFRLNPYQRAAIARTTHGKTTVWFYGGGFLDDDASEANMAQAIGMSVARGEPQPGRVNPQVADGDELAARLAEGLQEAFGTDTTLDPLWVVTDDEAQVVGRYADGGAAVAARMTPEGLRVYIGALHCPAKLLRNILKASGLRLYSDSDDVILTDGEFLTFVATSAGPKRVEFPARRDVVNALDGTEVARGVEFLEFEAKLGETRMLLLK